MSHGRRGAVAAAGLAIGLVAACGGGTSSDTTPATIPAAAPSADQSGEMVPPEKMDEINRNLARKRQVMSRCLSLAIDNKELPRNSKGKVTVELVIAPNGKADEVKIVRASVESPMLNDCVIARIKEIQFPELPRPYVTSYTYGFEAT
jgi:hypothetical protein